MKHKRILSMVLAICLMLAVVPMTASAEEYPVISVGSELVATIGEGGEAAYFTFTPTYTESYTFYSVAEEDTRAYLYDSDMNELAYNDDGTDTFNFSLTYTMEAGKTYILRASYYYSNVTGAFSVFLVANHNFGEGEVVKEATCTEDGSIIYTCGDCGEVYSEVIPGGHILAEDSFFCTRCGEEVALEGSCGENLTWRLNSKGTLTISGTGDMSDFVEYTWSPWHVRRASVKKVVIEKGVTSIGDHAFFSCANLENVTIPDGVTTIGESAFHGCENVKTIKLPDSVTSIGEAAFDACKSLESFVIPKGVTEIQTWTFELCDNLKSVTFPEGLTRIGERAFAECISLESVTIPDSVKEIGGQAFRWCRALTEAKLPAELITLGGMTFNRCGKLREITIPAKVTHIYGEDFFGCVSLTSVTFLGDAPEIGDMTFYGDVTTAYYPANNPTWTEDVMQGYGGDVTWVEAKSVYIKTEPKTGYAKMGDTVKATVKAEGAGLSYQWYIKNAGAEKYSKSSVKTATYSAKMSDKVKGRRVYCVVTDAYGNSVKSKTVILREAVSIVTEPKTTYAKSGETAKVTVEASGDELSYQWYVKNAGSDKYSKSSITKSTYSVKMSDKVNGRRVYCVVTDKYGKTVQSKSVLLREAVSIVTEPKTTYAKSGKTAKVTVEASGDELTYQWYVKNAGSDKYSKSSITKSTYSVKMTDKVNGRRVYCVVTDKYGNTVQSKTVVLRMAATITTQPKDVTVAKGETAKVTVKAVGDDLTYQWYIKNEGSSKFSKSSITKATYSVKMSDKVDGRQVYCVVTDKYGKTVQSKTVTLNMK